MEVTRRQVALARRPCSTRPQRTALMPFPCKSANAGPIAAAERRSYVKSRALEAEQYPPLVVFHHHQFRRLINRLAKIVGCGRARGPMHQPIEGHGHAVRTLGNSLELQLRAHRMYRSGPGRQHQRQKRDPHTGRENWPRGRSSMMADADEMQQGHQQRGPEQRKSEPVPAVRGVRFAFGTAIVKPPLIFEPRLDQKPLERFER